MKSEKARAYIEKNLDWDAYGEDNFAHWVQWELQAL